MTNYCREGCGIDFDEFPELQHPEGECPGPDCTCYEVTGGHQPGCPFGRSLLERRRVK